jgi:type I restriction-modification system DNA methylase subunit
MGCLIDSPPESKNRNKNIIAPIQGIGCSSFGLISHERAIGIEAKDGFDRDADGKKITFDYMLANPPFGVEWKQQARFIEQEANTLGYNGRFGAGLPRINDGSLLFLQHVGVEKVTSISRMRISRSMLEESIRPCCV